MASAPEGPLVEPRRLVVTERGSPSCSIFSKDYKSGKDVLALDLRHTAQLIEVDDGSQTVRCGAAVTMESLVRATLAHGMIPLVQPDFRRMTVGGSIMGTICESSSHQHGHFVDACAWLLLRKGDGTSVTVTKADEAFHEVNGSFGTLCTLLEACVRCRRCAPWVRVTYSLLEDEAAGDPSAGVAHMAALAGLGSCEPVESSFQLEPPLATPCERRPFEYLDALHLSAGWDGRDSLSATAVMCGEDALDQAEIASLPSWESSRDGYWFFEHVIQVARKLRGRQGKVVSEIVPLESYVFRYDRGAFWMARPLRWSLRAALQGMYSLPVLLLFLASAPPLRPLLGDLFTPSALYRVLRCAPVAAVNRKMVICDFHIPLEDAATFIRAIRHEVPISTPLWLCLVRVPERAQPLSPHGHYYPGSGKLLMNIGVWGRVGDGRGVAYSCLLERKCTDMGGRKMLYSSNFYSGEEWDSIYNADNAYTAMRKRWDADGRFPHLFTKTCGISSKAAASMSSQSLGSWLSLWLDRLVEAIAAKLL
ncbi:unnamed protein product [Polarella glacialis]|uniref:Delta(24)-sterol reductase n=1 Tax=Polarella glacialis TaxID=89957 RepID=A0A813IKA6_POLGL|nr:unnamed protein product [Polarella glacialis]